MNSKQVIIIRKDLKMRRGKEIAQGAHASMGAVLSVASYWERPYITPGEPDAPENHLMCIKMNPDMRDWLMNGSFTKIGLICDSEEEMLALTEQAKDAGLIHFLCQDSGRTEFGGVPTYTALAIGPAEADEIDKITANLKLY